MQDCLFCKIVAGQIPSSKVYEDETVYAFRDINPQAPVHILVLPKKHVLSAISGYNETENGALIAHIFGVITKIAEQQGLTNGYRVITNCGDDGAQSVKHLHFHLLGGKQLSGTMC